MARTAIFSDAGDEEDSTTYDTTTTSRRNSRRATEASPSPSISFGSDKENRGSTVRDKGKGRVMGPPETPASEATTSRRGTKRKLGSRDQPVNATQALHDRNLEQVTNKDLYDPEQDIDERRHIRKSYRDLSSNLTGKLALFHDTPIVC